MTKYRILALIALLPLLAGCFSPGDPRGPGTGFQPDRAVTNAYHNEFLSRGPSR